MLVEYVETKSLVPYARNARIHSAAQIEEIARSIEEFGFNDPVGVWTNCDGEMEIVEGHGRVLAAMLLDVETVPVIRLDDMTDRQRREYAIAHNATTDMSSFDPEMLRIETSGLDYRWDGLGVRIVETDFLDDVFTEDDSSMAAEPPKPFRLVCPNCGGEL